ncbi:MULTISPECIES: phage tail protein [Serratia]|uniref:phage tail protein n=1 Tax=Serratia TaxID=613 RepID=UPI00313F28E7
MFHIDNASSVAEMPTVHPQLFTQPRWFTEGGEGIEPTYPGCDWFNIIQAEMLNVLALAGIAPDKTKLDQFAQAIRLMSTDYMMPVGIPYPWPGSSAPAGFALMVGQAFDGAAYPKLAQAYPGLVIPDMRSQTIKGLPAANRALLSYEADGNKYHAHGLEIDSTDLGTKETSNDPGHEHDAGLNAPGAVWDGNYVLGTDASESRTRNKTSWAGQHLHTIVLGWHGHTGRVNGDGNPETTVKNIAFNYIVRLA